MKGKKEIAILFFIIVVLLFYIYSEKGEKTRYTLPEITKIESEAISRMSIRQQGKEISLIKEGDRWLVGEDKFPADDAIVKTMLENVTGLTLSTLASESKSYALYDLDEDKKITVTAYKGDDPLRTIIIGKPASSYRHTFVMIDEDYRVYHAEGNIRNQFDKKVPDLRDKKVMVIQDEISELVLNDNSGEMKIVRATAPVSVDVAEQEEDEKKEEEPARKWIDGDGKPLKESEIDDVISTLSSLSCDEFIEGKRKEDYTSPIYTVTLKGTGTYTMAFFQKQDSKYPAVSSENAYPFLLSEWKAKKIMKDFDSLAEPE